MTDNLLPHQLTALRDLYFRWQDRIAEISLLDAQGCEIEEWEDALASIGALWDLPCRSGKTRAALTLIYHWQDWLQRWKTPPHLMEIWARPNLVLAPSDMVRDGAWVEDWEHVCPPWDKSIELLTLKTVSPEKTQEFLASLKPFDTVVMTYHTFRERGGWIKDYDWGLFIADECHMLKNPKTYWTQTAYRVNSVARLGLSATPFTNYVHELIHVLLWLQGRTTPWNGRTSHIWPSVWKWEAAHCAYKYIPPKTGLTFRKVPAGAYNPEHMYHWLRKEVMFSATPAEVSDAPEPNIRPVPIPLSVRQKEAYDQLARGMLRWADKHGKTETFSTGPALAQMGYLFQLCADARQLRESVCARKGRGGIIDYTSMERDMLKGWSINDMNSKLKLLKWLVDKDEQVLVLTGFKHVARYVTKYLQDYLNLSAGYITGDIHSKHRQPTIDNFNSGRTQVVTCTKAAWQGITLAAPNVVLLGFVDHVPGMVRQAVRRAWTMKDTHATTVYDCYAPGTVEEWNRNRLAAKDQYATVLTNGQEPALFKPVSLEQALWGG